MKKISSSKNKKGVTDVFYILGVLFAISFMIYIFIIVGNGFYEKLGAKMQEDEDYDVAYETYTSVHEKNIRLMDYIFLGGFFTLVLGMLFTSFLIRASPVWIVVFIIFSIIAVIGAANISNYYQAVEDKAQMQGVVDSVPKMNFIMENLVIITVSLCAVSIIVIYGKNYFLGGYLPQ